MVSRDEVLKRVRDGDTYEAIGRELGIGAGKAYMIATGVPADGSDSLAPEDLDREGLLRGGTQALVGVPHHNPNRPEQKPGVVEWVRARARGDAQMQAAASSRKGAAG